MTLGKKEVAREQLREAEGLCSEMGMQSWLKKAESALKDLDAQ